ncbi:hypothetical protein B0E53_05129 [Micromonospora sp. MH33]|uniref:RipA family octameric membrane protein n=1 Tax=Micromonospora sp. MH33 TaxID=1945509 RepID=UPI000D2DD0D5|nr:hypothetical protein [Micromonospora sp. MH33]PSK62952.1 hypothetical protein B0E53_05129 [Micromonospora sp. MH33]
MDVRTIFTRYLGAATTPIDAIRPTLWNSAVDRDGYAAAGKDYQNAILEQYKLYAEMADRISARRSLTNTFFLTLNTAAFALIGTFWRDRPAASPWLLVFPLVALIVQCVAWFVLVRSYRQLNSAKYVVLGVLEERLPASPYWRAEWKALGEGRDKAKYWPLTHLEQWVPAIFAATYLAAFVVAVSGA